MEGGRRSQLCFVRLNNHGGKNLDNWFFENFSSNGVQRMSVYVSKVRSLDGA